MWRTGAGGAANLFRWPDFTRRSCNAGWQFWCCASSSLLYPTFESNVRAVLSSRRVTNILYHPTLRAGCLWAWSGHTGRFSSETPEESLPSAHKHSHAESVSMFLELYLFLSVWWPRYNACDAGDFISHDLSSCSPATHVRLVHTKDSADKINISDFHERGNSSYTVRPILLPVFCSFGK